MVKLQVSYDALEDVGSRMSAAAERFAGDALPTGGGTFGAAEVEHAFSTLRTMQASMTTWLGDTATTLGKYATDTASAFANADRALASGADAR